MLLVYAINVARRIEKLMRDIQWEGCGEGKRSFGQLGSNVLYSYSKFKGGLAIGNIVAGRGSW